MPERSVIPDFTFGTLDAGQRIVTVGELYRTADPPQERQLQLGGDGAVVPLIYGEVRVAPLINVVIANANSLVILGVLCEGAIQEIGNVYENDQLVSASITINKYLGTQSQTADSLLVAAFAAQSKVYTNALLGTAYIVASVPAGVTQGFPRFVVQAKGRKVYDPRDGTQSLDSATWKYSNNPALCLADFLRDPNYGRGKTLDWLSVASAANYCDELVGGVKRKTVNIIFRDPQPVDSIQETLRAYAGCFVVPDGSVIRLVPDRKETIISTTPPGASLEFTATHTSTVNPYTYWKIHLDSRVIQTGDQLWFDTLSLITNGGGMDIRFTDATYARLQGVVDQDARIINSGSLVAPNGAWYTRKFSLTPVVGKTVSWYDIVLENDLVQQHVAWFRNIRICDSSGNLRAVVYGGANLLVSELDFSNLSTAQIVQAVYVPYSFNTANIIDKTIKIKKRSSVDLPTVVDVGYTDTTTNPWREGRAIAKLAGVDAGTVPRRESRVPLHGIDSYPIGYREAVERLNHYTVEDLQVDFVSDDNAIKVLRGALAYVTHPIGLTNKLVRINQVDDRILGRWAISALEYQANAYSDIVQSQPGFGDTGLPDPRFPPTPTGLVVTEELYRESTIGAIKSRLVISWTQAQWPFVGGYRVDVYDELNLVDTGTRPNESSPSYKTPPLPEYRTYTVNVFIVSSISGGQFVSATPATQNIITNGKLALPLDLATIDGIEIGGEVRLFWTYPSDIDLDGTEVRYGTTGSTWESATVLGRPAYPDVGFVTRQVPAGTWRFYIKTRDSVRNAANPFGQYSVNAKTKDIVVTQDTNSFLADTYQFVTPALTNMHSYRVEGDWNRVRYITSIASDTMAALFPLAMSNYGNPISTYHASATSKLETEAKDFGVELSGTWSSVITYTDISGTSDYYQMLSSDGTAYTDYKGTSVKAIGRFADTRHEALTTSTVLIVGLPKININVVARQEDGQATTLNNYLPIVVDLAGDYARAKTIQLTPQTLGRITTGFDMVEVSSGRGIKSGYCMRFFGLDGYIQIAHSASLSISQPITVECLFKNSATGVVCYIASKDTESGTRYAWRIYINASDKLVLEYFNGSTFSVTSTPSVNDNIWHHAALRIDSTTLSGFLDGILIGTATITGTISSPTGRMAIGAQPPFVGQASYTNFYDGLIDEVRVWNSARTNQQIADNQQIEITTASGLQGRWGLNESAFETTAADSSGNSNTGTVVGTTRQRPYDGFDFYAWDLDTYLPAAVPVRWLWQGV